MSPSSRIVCVFLPSFPLAAHLRANPERRHDAIAIVEGQASAARIIALSESASELGLTLGMSVPQAKAIAPTITLRPRDLEAERGCQRALIEVGEAFSPRVEDAGIGLIYLDAFKESQEDFLARSLIRRARKVDLFAQVAFADSKLVARIAAQREHDVTIVEAGQASVFLNALPLHHLHPSFQLSGLFAKWGLRTIGDFAKLSERDVLVRLGKEGGHLHAQARGVDPEPLVPHAHESEYVEGVELDWEIGEIEPFLVIARGLLERLITRLSLVSLACRKIDIYMKLEPQGHEGRTLELPAPTNNLESLLTLIRTELEMRAITGPVIAIRIQIQPEHPRATQLSLFGPPAMSTDVLSNAIARLAALLGQNRVGSPKAIEGPCPEKFSMARFNPPNDDKFLKVPKMLSERKPLAAVRVFRPALLLDVTAEQNNRRPRRMRSTNPYRLRVDGDVERAAGPWLIEDAWWTDDSVRREYWDVALTDKSLYRIYYEPIHEIWFLDGIYD